MSIGTGRCCVSCQTYLVPKKNEVVVLETFEDGRPYKIYLADLFECPDCKYELISGFGLNPISEHYLPNFKKYLDQVTHTINGCPRSL